MDEDDEDATASDDEGVEEGISSTSVEDAEDAGEAGGRRDADATDDVDEGVEEGAPEVVASDADAATEGDEDVEVDES